MSAVVPDWLRSAWATAFVVVAAVHLRHVLSMSGQRRWWHAGHTAMAAGMTVMYLLPRRVNPTLYRTGAVGFAMLALVLATAVLWLWRREGDYNPLWVTVVADTVIMAVMFSAPPSRLGTVGFLPAAYLTVAAAAWAFGLWSRARVFRAGGVSAVDLTAHSGAGDRATLGVMGAGMAFMLVAMR